MNISKYNPEFCSLLVEHMSEGLSYDSFPATVYDKYNVYVGLSTMYEWEKAHPAWAAAKEVAFTKSLIFYEKRASAKVGGREIIGVVSKDIDSYVLMGMLKTRFHKIYGDKARLEHDVSEETRQDLKLAYSLSK